MNVRRLLVTASVALGLLATSAEAAGTVSLDGSRRTHAEYAAGVYEPAIGVGGPESIRTDIEPNRADCTKTSCDETTLKLSLPRGSTAGRFVVAVHAQRELNLAVYLYDAKGEAVGEADVDTLQGMVPSCCTAAPQTGYTRGFTIPRLGAGKYTLVVYDRAGAGAFTVEVDYRAHPPDRPRKR